jgi:uncharacterized delta-60 repeat protein
MSVAPARAAGESEPGLSVPSPGVVNIAVRSSSGPGAVSIQRDGSLVVAATTISDNPRRVTVSRFDLTSGGKLTNHATTQVGDIAPHNVAEVTIAANGEIILAGDAYAPGVVNSQYGGSALAFLVARFSAAGKLDMSFAGGWVLTDVGRHKNHNIAHGVVVQPDGKVIVTGNSLVPYWLIMTAYSFATVRYNTEGSLDRSFGDEGRVITRMGTSREDSANVVLLSSDGKIIVVGAADTRKNVYCEGKFLDCLQSARSDFALARYLPDGQLDRTFNTDGRIGPIGLGVDSAAYAATLDVHNRIVVAGSVTLAHQRPGSRGSFAPAIARYTNDGALDPAFGGSGVVQLEADGAFTRILALAAQPDGKSLLLGISAEANADPAQRRSGSTLTEQWIRSLAKMACFPCGLVKTRLGVTASLYNRMESSFLRDSASSKKIRIS